MLFFEFTLLHYSTTFAISHISSPPHSSVAWFKDRVAVIIKTGKSSKTGKTSQGQARTCKARHEPARTRKNPGGQARTGKDRQGRARTGKDRQGPARTGKDWQGPARTGKDRQGPVRTQEDRLGQTRTRAESSTAGKDQQGPARIGKNMVLPTYIFRFGGFVKLSPGWMVLPGQNSWWHPLVLLYRQLTCNIDIQHWNIGLKYTGHQTCNKAKNIICRKFQKKTICLKSRCPCFF